MDPFIHNILIWLRDQKRYDLLVALASTSKCYCHHARNVKARHVMHSFYIELTGYIASFPLGFTNATDVMDTMSPIQFTHMVIDAKRQLTKRADRFALIEDYESVPI